MAQIYTLAAPGGNGAALPNPPFTLTGTHGTGTGLVNVFNGSSAGNAMANAVYLQTPPQGSYNDSAYFALGSVSSTDQEMLARFTFAGTSTGTTLTPNQNEQYAQLCIRTDGTAAPTAVQPNNGYQVLVDYHAAASSLQIAKIVSAGKTNLGTSGATTFDATTRDVWVRFQAVGTTIRARMWKQGITEPSTWDISVTDSALTSGKPMFFHGGGSSAASKVIVVQALTIDDLTTPSPPAPPQALLGLVRHNVHLRRR